MNTLTVSVTQDDIEKGSSSPRYCPVALAIRRETGAKDVEVDLFGATVVTRSRVLRRRVVTRYDLPVVLKAFIRRFDDWGPKGVEPTTGTLERV